jgi:hypothetical protein
MVTRYDFELCATPNFATGIRLGGLCNVPQAQIVHGRAGSEEK